MPIVNFKLEGELLKFVERYISSGYSSSKAEVIRIALTKLRDEELLKHVPGPLDHDKSIR